MTKNTQIKKVVKGMAAYFTEVKNIKLGSSDIDFLLLNVPPICNYRCKKCFTRAGFRKIKNPLSLDEWFSVINEGKKLGAKNVSILGEGEPLIYKDIKEILSYINKQGMIPMIATNAFAMDSKMANFLFENNVTVGFSLDTLDEKEYNEFCGGMADFSKFMKNVEYARKLFAKSIVTENGYKIYRLVLHMTVTPKNYHRLNQLRDFCGEDIFFDCQPLANVGIAEDNRNFFGEEMNYEEFRRYAHKIYAPMVFSQTECNRDICCLFYYGLAVNYSGDVMFDTHAIQPQKYIGNIRDFPTKELLIRVKKLRKYFLDNYKSGYCPIRDKTYNNFLKSLKKEKKDFLWT
jgi:MoaA/NifB/PqqE/SkfB family radical SAM enzyme